MCEYQYFYEGIRSRGANIPSYAQGAFFPGDEPEMRCRLTDETCTRECCPKLKQIDADLEALEMPLENPDNPCLANAELLFREVFSQGLLSDKAKLEAAIHGFRS